MLHPAIVDPCRVSSTQPHLALGAAALDRSALEVPGGTFGLLARKCVAAASRPRLGNVAERSHGLQHVVDALDIGAGSPVAGILGIHEIASARGAGDPDGRVANVLGA